MYCQLPEGLAPRRRGNPTDSRVEGGDEALAQSLPAPGVLVLESAQHALPHVLKTQTQAPAWSYTTWVWVWVWVWH